MKRLFIILFAAVFLTGCGTSYITGEGREHEFDDSGYYDYAKENYTIDDLFTSDEIKDYVRDYYDPIDIYDYDYLIEFVTNYDLGYVLDYISDHFEDELLEYIQELYYPEDIFPELEEEEEE